ncbi:NLR family CARD domain-containing protein 4-like [Centruroides vittatus]|uniref:NLR family CARD domain-containing protein 4-like n=1 Tax=Centruroides vittatus TaxID=120091 RepID=UPI00350F72A9
MMLKCENVHIGPKIEIHSAESKASSLKKESEERDEIFDICCQEIKDKYVTRFSYMRSFLWEGKRNDFPLKDYFVELTVEKTDLFGKENGDNISLNEIFSIQKDGHQTILVTGHPGYGKSTLCKKIAYDWASTDYLQHFHLTFIVILRELGDKSVKDALLDDMREYSPTDKDWKLRDRKQNILVILDGFDEIVDKSKIIKFMREESFDICRRMTIVVTSRPQAAEEIREDVRMRFSIQGFSSQNQEKYIQIMFKEQKSKANELCSALTRSNFYREISECPLMLHMLCCLHENAEMVKLETMADLYIKIFTLITERYVRKTNQEGKFKRGKYFVGESLLLALVKKSSLSITSENLKTLFPNEDERNFIIGLDILTFDSFSSCDNIIRYSFVHRTFREFLSALSVYRIYTSVYSLGYRIFDMELLFLLGLYKDDFLPKPILKYVENCRYDPGFMLRAHKEIKLKRNWEQFCSHARFIFDIWWDIRLIRDLLKLYEFKELYVYFSEDDDGNWTICESGSLSDWGVAKNCKIYYILTLYEDFSSDLYDIREPVSRIIDFLDVMNGNTEDIYFIGVTDCNGYDSLYRFTNINYDLNFTNIRELLSISDDEQLIGLQCLTSETIGSESISCVLSLLQYETLGERIILRPDIRV